MKILLSRKLGTAGCTLGDLFIDDMWECFTLEDQVRNGQKVAGVTAIPAGEYRVVIDQSARFGRFMPHVLDVPGFTGIRIHAGNTAEDTEGCILLGQIKGVSSVGQSRAAFAALFAKFTAATVRGEAITLRIE